MHKIENGIKQISTNRKALHDFFVLDNFEADIELAGTEVKSVRQGQVNLKGSCLARLTARRGQGII